MAMQYNAERFTLANDFSTRTDTTVTDDEFRTVEEIDVETGESVTIGRGSSRAPLSAEGSAAGDIQSSAPADIDGKFRFVVLNSQNNVVSRIVQGSINDLEQTRANALDGYLLPNTGQEIAEPYKLGLQLRTDSGTADYSSSNSSLSVDGVRGESRN
jgi:hypothetical protein